MDEDFYLQFSRSTFPGPYLDYLRDQVPDDVREVGRLVRSQIIHKMILKNGNTGSNTDLRYGDMTKIPWYRQCEDDTLTTVAAILSELFRLDSRGIVSDRAVENRLILTCRSTAILMASILKSKGIPARVRSGFAPYFKVEGLPDGKSCDHWINQYWSKERGRWITIDVDGSIEPYIAFDPYHMPEGLFDYAADAWLKVREGKMEGDHFWNAGGTGGLQAIAWELFYDFHSLMNSEPLYIHTPVPTFFVNFPKLSEQQLQEFDDLARLMQHPDNNLTKLQEIWNAKKEFRLLGGSLL